LSYSGEIVTESADSSELRLALEDDDWGGSSLHTLWINPEHDRLLAGNRRHVGQWTTEGNLLWTWEAPGDLVVHGATFDRDGRTALVSVGNRVVQIKDGRATTLVRAKTRFRAPTREDSGYGSSRLSFVDQTLGLPGGAIAFTIVDLKQTWVEPEGSDEEELMAEEPADAMD
jgi:hypothetical protein